MRVPLTTRNTLLWLINTGNISWRLVFVHFRLRLFRRPPYTHSFFSKPQRINPPHRIRRIRIKIQPTRIADRVFADKPSDPWIIVPIPIVVQPCFVIVVLPLKPDRVGQALVLCPFRALFFDFSPRFVLRAPGDLAGGVDQFLWRAEVVALVPRQYVNR